MGNLFNAAINAQRQFILMAAKHSKPADSDLQKCLEPQVKAITAVTEFRESSRRSKFFNHLSSVSEAIPGMNHTVRFGFPLQDLPIRMLTPKFSFILDFDHSNTGSPCKRNERCRYVLY